MFTVAGLVLDLCSTATETLDMSAKTNFLFISH